jgi:hypothetical protein
MRNDPDLCFVQIHVEDRHVDLIAGIPILDVFRNHSEEFVAQINLRRVRRLLTGPDLNRLVPEDLAQVPLELHHLVLAEVFAFGHSRFSS